MESQHIEHKKNFGKEVIISLAAFANSEGGRVIVGLDDAGVLHGVEVGPETLQRYQNEIKVATYPQLFPKIWIEEQEGKQLIIFEISEFPVKPVSYKNRYYKRINNSNHLLTLDEIVDLQQQSLSVSYDAYPSTVSLDDLDKELIQKFFDHVNKRGRVTLQGDLRTNLTKLKLIRDEKVTFAAALLFGEPDFSIRIGRFKAADTIIDDLVIRGPLYGILDEAMTFIKKHINLSYHFDGSIQRKERWQYPIEALRELLLNCMVHRDYKNFSDIIIKVFDDRIVFTNPGSLYGNLRIEDIKRDDYTSSIRNKLLAEAFYLTGDIERYGTGFVRVRKSLEAYPELSLFLEEMGGFFKVDLFLEASATEQVEAQVEVQVGAQVEAQVDKDILAACSGKPRSSSEIAAILGHKKLSGNLRKALSRLKYSRLLEYTIPDKPKSKLQKYRLTPLGKKYIKSREP